MKDNYSKAIKIIIVIGFSLLFVYEAVILVTRGLYYYYGDMVDMSTKFIRDLSQGINPYGKEWLYDETALPMTYYESGFFHLLPAALIAMIPGVDALAAGIIVHGIYVVLTVAAMYFFVRNLTKSKAYGMAAAGISFFVINIGCTVCNRPDTLCACLIILGMNIMLEESRSHIFGSDNKIREWQMAVILVMLMYLKIHYASIMVAVIFVYLKNIKNKRVWFLGLKTMAVGIIVTAVTQLLFPTFFSTYGIRVYQMFTANTDHGDIEYMLQKWKDLFMFHIPLAVVTVVISIVFIKSIGRIFKDDFGLFMSVNIMVNLIALCFMGMHKGSYLSYHNIMLMPVLIAVGVYLVSLLSRKYRILGSSAALVFFGIYVCMLVNNNEKPEITDYADLRMQRQENYAFFDEYSNGKMLISSAKCAYAYTHDLYQWDYGDQIYMPADIGTSPKWNFLFPYTNLYRERNREYGLSVLEQINNKEYSLIVTDSYNIFGIGIGLWEEIPAAIEENYEVIKEEGDGFVKYWVPKE